MVDVISVRSKAGRRSLYIADHLAGAQVARRAAESKRHTDRHTKATVSKIITEILSSGSNTDDGKAAPMNFAKETRDLLIECCVEFITMISAEANEIAEKDAKKTIACEHITKALEDLGFGEYVGEVLKVADGFKSTQVVSLYTLCIDGSGVEEGERGC